MTKDEALTMALEALENHTAQTRPVFKTQQAITAIKEALAQDEQEPLTDKQILADETLRYYFGQNGGAGPVSKQGRKIVNAIEAAHGIKETEK
jgi:hypothetical protein